MRPAIILTIFRKELVETLRDRRTGSRTSFGNCATRASIHFRMLCRSVLNIRSTPRKLARSRYACRMRSRRALSVVCFGHKTRYTPQSLQWYWA